MTIEPKIIGYHVNSQDKCKPFLEDEKIVVSEDIYWLGKGMYFWDNMANTNYWVAEKKRKEGLSEVWILRALISLEDDLDLSDEEILEQFNVLWLEYRKKKNNYYKGKYIKPDSPLGMKINLMFDYYSTLNEKFKVIKAVGLYENRREQKFLHGSKVTNKVKILYCVRDKSVILDKEKLEVV